MNENNIDKLIDSAFAKDRSQIPEQPEAPSAALLEAVRAARPVASVSSGGFFTTMTVKIIGTIALMSVSAVIVYFIVAPKPPEQPVAPAPIQVIAQDTVLQQGTTQSLTEDTVKSRIKKAKSDSTAKQAESNELIFPTTPPALYPKDSANVNLKKQ